MQRKLFGEPETKAEIRIAKLRKKHAGDAITFPIIVMSGGWGDVIPEEIKDFIQLSRLKQFEADVEDFLEFAVNAEVAAYLMTASLSAPLARVTAQVYFFACNSFMTETYDLPDFLNVTTLNNEEEDLLNKLKRDIRRSQIKNLKKARKQK